MTSPYIKMRSNADLKYLLDEVPQINARMARYMRDFLTYPQFIVQYKVDTMWMFYDGHEQRPRFACEFSRMPVTCAPTNSPRHFVETIRRIEAARPS